jgi:hypothetical protein
MKRRTHIIDSLRIFLIRDSSTGYCNEFGKGMRFSAQPRKLALYFHQILDLFMHPLKYNK